MAHIKYFKQSLQIIYLLIFLCVFTYKSSYFHNKQTHKQLIINHLLLPPPSLLTLIYTRLLLIQIKLTTVNFYHFFFFRIFAT